MTVVSARFSEWDDAGDDEDVLRLCRSLLLEIPPRDKADALFTVAPEVHNAIRRCMAPVLKPYPPGHLLPLAEQAERPLDVDRLFGVPLHVDSSMEPWTVTVYAENATDRALRRAQERGQTYNVVKAPDLVLPYPSLPPDPTLKALVRHWWKRVRRG